MRFSTALWTLSAFVALASAQSVPPCALTCISSANTNGCSSTDLGCLCKNDEFIKSAAACIDSTCTGNDVATARESAQELCAGQGVSLSLPAGTASGTGTPSNTAQTSTSQSPSQSASSNNNNNNNGARMFGVDVVAGIVGAGVAALVL
ncbi:hypothetical protein AAF712_012530 [Marasmius tenuissimus]|uniref:CFEM domain-containing protein n=1 Tax=Marasmius tenuissimus TaxID=585030 RepID=A0ABR2ZH24_9AGAR|nr:hypothetical protein PM082_008448 [Marasmius tenuissimus]